MIALLWACGGDPARTPCEPFAVWPDADGDGVGAMTAAGAACRPPPGWSAVSGDCDDAAADVFPGASETCDGRDEDCDGEVDEGLVGSSFADADGDGFGDPGTRGEGCVGEGVAEGGDCDDADASVHPDGPVRFTDATADAGFGEALHWDPAVTPLGCPNEQMTGGAAVGDVDGDGWPDVFLPRIGLPDALFRNDGGRFADVAAEAGLDAVGHHNGALFFDLEADGDLDLFVTSLVGPYRLHVNDGSGHFTEEAAARGVALPTPEGGCGMDFSAAAADVDGDGDLDLHHAAWQEETTTNNDRARLWLNDGTGHFTDGTAAAGLVLTPFATFTSAFVDLDDDVDPDLLVVADWGDSHLFLNDGLGRFADATAAAGVGTDENGMGSAVGDPDGDGDPDWFVTSIHDEAVPCPEKWGCSGNRFYENDGTGVFADRTDAAGIRDGQWGWGAAFVDYDLDGREDLVQVGGMPIPEFAGETSRTWRGLGDGTFDDDACPTGLVDPGQGRAVVPFDADLDGDPDVLVVGNAEVPRFWQNDQRTGNHWLAVVAPVGTRVRATTASGTQTRWIAAGGSFLASGPAEARFGLGAATEAEVEVRWPDGTTTRSSVPADGVWTAER